MTPVDPAVTTSIIAAWGAPGAIILILLGAVVWLAMNLKVSYQDRHEETKNLLSEKYKESADTVEVLRDLKGSIDASRATMEATLEVLKLQKDKQ